MGKFEEIRETATGHYAFFIGVHQYTLATPMDKERLARIVHKIQKLVDSFPANMTQDERLFLSLITVMNRLDKLEIKISDASSKIPAERKQD